MKPILVSQRVAIEASYGERRDCLDQAWARLLAGAGLLAVPVPNMAALVAPLAEASGAAGVLLTGGSDLAAYGGHTPERDETEAALLDLAHERGWPAMGVCRGMQLIQHRHAIELVRVEGHVQATQQILILGQEAVVNSYHGWGAYESRMPLEVWARAPDGVIKGVRRADERLLGLMWHPERIEPFAARDLALLRTHFGT
jgi:putative glutamine amidotransferase